MTIWENHQVRGGEKNKMGVVKKYLAIKRRRCLQEDTVKEGILTGRVDRVDPLFGPSE